MKRSLLTLLLATAATGSGWAHGGTYAGPPHPGFGPAPGGRGGGAGRGPSGPSSPGPSGPSGPSGPGPTTPPGAGPRNPFPLTPVNDELPDPTRWQLWWQFNHDAFLDLRARIHALATSSPENLAVLERKRLQALVVPELVKVIELGDRESVLRQTLLSLARLAKVRELDVPLARLTQLYLGRDIPNLQEAALLALGVGGDSASIGLLRHVLMDDAQGRGALVQPDRIPTRMRVFAAYALGLLGQRERSDDTRRQVVHALLFALGGEGALERELRVACALALGLVPVRPCETPEESQDPARQIEELHLCGGAQTEYVLAIANDAELDPWFRGHAAAALGRLARSAGAGMQAAEDHPVVLSRDELVRALIQLAKDARATTPVLQGCLLGLGFVADCDRDEADLAARDFLWQCVRRDGPMAQRFALVSLAAALGRPGPGAEPDGGWKEGSTLLLREFARAKGGWLSWNALALAVAGHGRAASRLELPSGFADALRTRLLEAQKVGDAAACALAIAVLGFSNDSTSAALQRAFQKQASPAYRVCGAIAIGMLGLSECQGELEKALDASGTSLDNTIAASLGLRLLRDPDVVPDLLKRLDTMDPKKPEDGLALVNALALLQDPFAGEALLGMLDDERRNEEVRAAIAWCLGMLADPDPDWTARYANGIDYSFLPWTLRSPMGDGRGLLDWR